MRGYVLSFCLTLTTLIASFAGFILLVDPYDIVGGPSFDGFNARKTRTHEDGGRVTRSHRLLTTDARGAVLGNSRIVDGFPDRVESWPGGLVNAGMRGSNAFELARAVVLAGRNPELGCLIIGLDLDDFGAHGKAQSTYWITALPDGSRSWALARMALSPHAFARALQTWEDNRTGGSDTFIFQDRYEAGWQHARFEDSLPGAMSHYRAYRYDPERVAFLLQAVEAANASGLQVLMFLHPMHAYREEALHAAGLSPYRDEVVRELAVAAERMNAPARQSCVDGPSVQFWDFGGFGPIAISPPPGPMQEMSHPYYHEPPHYRPVVGEAILARLQGANVASQLGADEFGRAVRPDEVDNLADLAAKRRQEWRQSDPVGQRISARLTELAHEPEPSHGPLTYLTRDDRAAMARDVRKLIKAGR